MADPTLQLVSAVNGYAEKLRFVQSQPASLPMLQMVERAHAKGLSMSPRFIRQLRTEIANSNSKPGSRPIAKQRPTAAAKKRMKFTGISAFIRNQPLDMPTKDVLKAAKAAGIPLSKNANQIVYSIRFEMRQKRGLKKKTKPQSNGVSNGVKKPTKPGIGRKRGRPTNIEVAKRVLKLHPDDSELALAEPNGISKRQLLEDRSEASSDELAFRKAAMRLGTVLARQLLDSYEGQ